MAKKKEGTLHDEYTLKGSSYWGVLLFAILIFVDQITKVVADVYFSASETPNRIDIIPGWISLCIEYNPGIAYGMGSNAKPWMKLLVILATAVMMVAFAVAYFKIDKRRSFLRLAIVFIVAGGVGNLIDRVYYRVWEADAILLDRGVRDMVDLSRFGFAVCNFADFFITGGAVMLVIAMVFLDRDAIFPMGEKYRALAKEHAEELEKNKQSENALQGGVEDETAPKTAKGLSEEPNAPKNESGNENKNG